MLVSSRGIGPVRRVGWYAGHAVATGLAVGLPGRSFALGSFFRSLTVSPELCFELVLELAALGAPLPLRVVVRLGGDAPPALGFPCLILRRRVGLGLQSIGISGSLVHGRSLFNSKFSHLFCHGMQASPHRPSSCAAQESAGS